MPVKSTQNGIFGEEEENAATADSSEDEGRVGNVQVKAKVSSRKRRREVSSESDDDTPRLTVVKSKRRRRHSPEIVPSEDEELHVPRSKRKKTTKLSDDEEPRPPRASKTRTSKRKPTQDDESDESDMIEVMPARGRRHKAARHPPDSEEQEEEEDAPSRSKRRRIRKRPVTPSESEKSEEEEEDEEEGEIDNANETDEDDGEEREDLQEDLAFLRSSPLPDRGKLRSAHEKPKSERQKALEALKKRRAGTSDPPSSATPVRGRRIVIESDSDSELEIIKEEQESDEENVSDPDDEEEELSDRDANALDMFLEDEDDENFIDNDADAVIGEPILGPDDVMPLVISRLSSSKPKELFKYAIEWMVMKKIFPGFDSRSDIYRITFQKLDDEVKGLANSKFSSSAWTSDFTRALRARPNLMMMEISRQKKDIMDAHCEACNRRNHPASEELMFSGQPYNAESLEPLDNDTDSDSNKDSDDDDDSELSADSEAGLNGEKPTYDAQGSRIPPESKTFCLGRTCKANAQVAHTLHHWRYHLYSWVKDHLAREGYLTAEKLVQRDGWTDKKREKAALKMVRKMEEGGEIRKLYHLYKDQITYATEARHDERFHRR
ncbi:hypothetical protein IQ06DRAFT_211636 [Phaeosphaeriaceae sp. SRC1lsM3a]|nr:hypothetical protein IQ06DRAFT_211636 [Stagonospora sp. SRC1lsM3a]